MCSLHHVETDLLSTSIDNIQWSTRVYGCFRNENIKTLKDLVQYTPAMLLRVPNFGRKSLKEVEEYLRENNLELGLCFEENENS